LPACPPNIFVSLLLSAFAGAASSAPTNGYLNETFLPQASYVYLESVVMCSVGVNHALPEMPERSRGGIAVLLQLRDPIDRPDIWGRSCRAGKEVNALQPGQKIGRSLRGSRRVFQYRSNDCAGGVVVGVFVRGCGRARLHCLVDRFAVGSSDGSHQCADFTGERVGADSKWQVILKSACATCTNLGRFLLACAFSRLRQTPANPRKECPLPRWQGLGTRRQVRVPTGIR